MQINHFKLAPFAFALILAGCGGGSTATNSAANVTTPDNTTNQNTDTENADTQNTDIQNNGVVEQEDTGNQADDNQQTEITELLEVAPDVTPEVDEQVLVTQLRQIIDEQNINRARRGGDNAIEQPLAQLGMELFFSKSLSGEFDVACASCHHPNLGGGDDLSLPIGVEAIAPNLLGLGREHSADGHDYDGGPAVPRNAPTTFNIALWDRALFHDGSIQNLTRPPSRNGEGDDISTPDSGFGVVDNNAGVNLTAAQAKFPVTSTEEMRGFDYQAGSDNQTVRNALAARLRGDTNELAQNNWLAAFRDGFEQPDSSAQALITFDNIATAMAAYENAQIFVDNDWQDFLQGNDSALSASAMRGAMLFYQDLDNGGFNCVSCHSGNLFSDENHHVVAFPQIGRGKGNGQTEDDDFGRFNVTNNNRDLYAFRTPTLLNVEVTAPYGHAGSFDGLEETVMHHLNVAQSIDNYQPENLAQAGLQIDNWRSNTELALARLQQLRVGNDGDEQLQDVTFNAQNVADVVEFLKAQTDACVADQSCLSDFIPNTNTASPDGNRIIAVNAQGDAL